MDEYIKREYAMDAVLGVYYDTPDIYLSDETFEAAILKIQAADVAPVRHGRWILDEKRYVIYCSECSAPVSYYPNIKDVRDENHYCPNCGAKMDGGKTDA